nr:hypothetical protein [uncultured Methanobrevibacter sp.]
MNMKNTVILLIFLLSVLGLIIGVYYTEDITSDSLADDETDMINEDADSNLAITSDENNTNYLKAYLT